jgi:hypothetical protein
MTQRRTTSEKFVVAIAVLAVVWLVGSTMVYDSGGINGSGLLPTLGSLIALWGALKSDIRLMWLGTGVVLTSAVLLVFSVGLGVVPAGLALTLGSVVLGRTSRSRS